MEQLKSPTPALPDLSSLSEEELLRFMIKGLNEFSLCFCWLDPSDQESMQRVIASMGCAAGRQASSGISAAS
jgi:hypothetical protein